VVCYEVTGKDRADEEEEEEDEYKSDLRKSMTKKLDPEFLANLDNLADLEDPAQEDHDHGSAMSFGGGESTAGGDAAMLEQDQELWRSIWSRSRGVLCSNRHINADYLEMEDEMMRNRGSVLSPGGDDRDGMMTGEGKSGESKDAFDHKADAKGMSSSGNKGFDTDCHTHQFISL
jgi:hypothetical protein